MRTLILLLALALAAPAALAAAQMIDEAALAGMTERQLVADFDATITAGRRLQAEVVQPRQSAVKPGCAMIPVVGGFVVGNQMRKDAVAMQEKSTKTQELQALRLRLLQLKRTIRAKHPAAWEGLKQKWCIDDSYLER